MAPGQRLCLFNQMSGRIHQSFLRDDESINCLTQSVLKFYFILLTIMHIVLHFLWFRKTFQSQFFIIHSKYFESQNELNQEASK